MRGFLNIFYKNNNSKVDVSKFNKMINHLKETKHEFLQRENDVIQSIYYTNESKSVLRQNTESDDTFVSLIGQYTIEEKEVFSSISQLNNDSLNSYVSELGGAFAISKTEFKLNELSFFTHIFRIDNIFFNESDQRIVVGTDPLLVSAASNEDMEPVIDIYNSVSFLMNGYFADDKTLFKNVKLMPPNSVMKVNSDGVLIQDIDDSINLLFSNKPNKILNDEIKEKYLNSLETIPNEKTLNIGLTGGKDSRLALLGLLQKEFKVNTSTRGFEDHPDVIIAKKLANLLGVNHKVNTPKISNEKGLDVHLEKKVLQTMKATSGQVFGYENINYNPIYRGNIGVTGVAALIMKGGYSYLNGINPKDSKKEIIKRFSTASELLNEGVEKDFHEFLKKLVAEDFQKGQYIHALFYRNGRWTSGTRLAKSYTSEIYSPFYDNIFTKSIIKVDKKYLDNGFIQYTLMKKLNPIVANLELSGSRWGFEENGPRKPENYQSWLKRAPLYPRTVLSGYNWKNLALKDNAKIVNKFKEILLSNPNHEIFKVVNYDKLCEIFENKITGTYSRFLWSLLSLYVYINYINKDYISDEKVNLTLPETKVKEVVSTPETIDFNEDILSLNESLKISKTNKKIQVNIDKKSKKNKYITIVNKSLNEGVADKKLNIKNREKVYFNLSMSTEIKFDMQYCIIFFKDNERIEVNWFSDTIGRSKQNVKGHSNIPKEANNFTLAFKILDKNSLKEFNINYLYVTLV